MGISNLSVPFTPLILLKNTHLHLHQNQIIIKLAPSLFPLQIKQKNQTTLLAPLIQVLQKQHNQTLHVEADKKTDLPTIRIDLTLAFDHNLKNQILIQQRKQSQITDPRMA
jgi:hypothetical protein